MSKRKHLRKSSQKKRAAAKANGREEPDQIHRRAARLACQGETAEARRLYQQLRRTEGEPARQALLESDLAALAAAEGDLGAARAGFRRALRIDADCQPALQNLALLEDRPRQAPREGGSPAPASPVSSARGPSNGQPAVKVAIVSLLFNWPSTAGGIVHTAETGRFLRRAGYDVQHFYARYADWGMGQVEPDYSVPSVPIEFDRSAWTVEEIKRRFREALGAFAPDCVIVTDSWNTKPLLAEAVAGYPYFLRLAALECLCPLNNVRLLWEDDAIVRCPRQQLATPEACRECVALRGAHSGGLHQAERALSGFAAADYPERLRSAFARAEAVLVVNPLIEQMVAPYARRVIVCPSGFDPARFPQDLHVIGDGGLPAKILFAGLVQEFMKGFHVLQAACETLWRKRQDFELLATADPAGQANAFTRYVGWRSQADLPLLMKEADLLVFPTVAEEALGRSAVEAMASGLPVVASRIGGLPFTVQDGLTGLLFDPGDAGDLARQIESLLDDPPLRERMGTAGRQRFEEHFTWDAVIERHYRPLLSRRAVQSAG